MTRTKLAVAVVCALSLVDLHAAVAGGRSATWRTSARAGAGTLAGEKGRSEPSVKASHALAGVGVKRLRTVTRKMGFAHRAAPGAAVDTASGLIREASLSGRMAELEAELVTMADTGRARAPRFRPKKAARDAGRALAGIDAIVGGNPSHQAARTLLAAVGGARLHRIARRAGLDLDIDTFLSPQSLAHEILTVASARGRLPAVRDALAEIARTGQVTVPSPADDLAAATRALSAIDSYDRTRPDHQNARDALATVGPHRLRQVVRRLGLTSRIYVEQSSRNVASEILEQALVTDVAGALASLERGESTAGPGLRAAARRAQLVLSPMRSFDRRRTEHMRAAAVVAELGTGNLRVLARDLQVTGRLALERAPDRVATDLLELASDHGRLDELKAAIATLATKR